MQRARDGRTPVAEAGARLKRKEIDAYASALEGGLGAKVFSEADTVDGAEGSEYNVLFVNGQVLGFIVGGRPMLTVRGLLVYNRRSGM